MSSDSSSDDETTLQLLLLARNYRNDVLIPEEEGESSIPQSRRYIYRDRAAAEQRLMNDYFVENAKYPHEYFKRRFRMSRRLFLRICEGINTYSIEPLPDYFVSLRQRTDAIGVSGFTTIQKVTSALRQLAYGTTPDAFDEYLQMSERTSRDTLQNFTKCVIDLYSNVYMREPTNQDIHRLYDKHHELHGFSGMLGSIDCMHWAWTKCPNAWKGQYTRGDHGYPTIMLEAVASYDMWIWHAYFGVAGSNNDLNVLNTSPLFNNLLNDSAPQVPYTVADMDYARGYYLADGIYPSWSAFVKGYSSEIDSKRVYFTRKQSSARKDVERTFGVLQGRFHILQQPARAYSVNAIRRIMYACIILHNMIIEDNGYNIAENEFYYVPVRNRQGTWIERCETYQRKTKELRDRETHEGLRADLVEHLWRNRDHWNDASGSGAGDN